MGFLLVAAWVAWTVHIWSTNGTMAGIGVLISWPAVALALALIVVPGVVVARLIRGRDEEKAEPAPEAGGKDEGADGEAEETESDGDAEPENEEEPKDDVDGSADGRTSGGDDKDVPESQEETEPAGT